MNAPSALDAVIVANEAAQQLDGRVENAERMASLYALRALIDGAPVTELMAAFGLHDDMTPAAHPDDADPLGMGAVFWRSSRSSPREALADRLGRMVRVLVMEGSS